VQLAAPSVTSRIARGTSAGKVLRCLIAAFMPAVAGVPPAIVMFAAAGMPLRIASLFFGLIGISTLAFTRQALSV